jgi:hypothetical protein
MRAHRIYPEYVFVAILLLASILACTSSGKKGEAKPICDRPAATWDILKPKTQEHITAACELNNGQCRKAQTVECRSSWVYAAQFLKVLDWEREHPGASTIDRLDAYVNYFLKPTLRMHEELWAEAITKKQDDREVMRKALALMREESKGVTEDHLAKLRDKIRKTPGPNEKAMLIEAYTLMRRLNTKAFEPFDTFDDYRAEVRTKLEQYEKVKVQLEFVTEDATVPVTGVVDKDGAEQPSEQKVAKGKVSVESKVEGVILIDGQNTKVNTPGSVEVEVGQHTVQLVYKDGKVSELKLIQVEPGAQVQVAFTPVSEVSAPPSSPPSSAVEKPKTEQRSATKGYLVVTSAPKGIILLNSKNTLISTPGTVEVEPGSHDVQVLFEDGEASAPKRVEAGAGLEVKIYFQQPIKPKKEDEKNQWTLE